MLCGQRRCSHRPGQRSGQAVARKEAKAHAEKATRPQDPTDMGDQYLNAGACAARLQPAAVKGKPSAKAALVTSDFSSMCQKRSGRFRSMVRNSAQSKARGKAIQ